MKIPLYGFSDTVCRCPNEMGKIHCVQKESLFDEIYLLLVQSRSGILKKMRLWMYHLFLFTPLNNILNDTVQDTHPHVDLQKNFLLFMLTWSIPFTSINDILFPVPLYAAFHISGITRGYCRFCVRDGQASIFIIQGVPKKFIPIFKWQLLITWK